jgi:hypothetical protein
MEIRIKRFLNIALVMLEPLLPRQLGSINAVAFFGRFHATVQAMLSLGRGVHIA